MAFLSHHLRRVKLAEGCFYEWRSIPLGVPQGTKLGPWLFLVLINDLEVGDDSNAELWKYVDDATTSHIVFKRKQSNSQLIADKDVEWSSNNRVQLNRENCKELRISFVKKEDDFRLIIVNVKRLECVTSAFLPCATISNDLNWNGHISQVIN